MQNETFTPEVYDPTIKSHRMAASDKSTAGIKGKITERLVSPKDPDFNRYDAELLTMYKEAIKADDYKHINGDIWSFIDAITNNVGWESHSFKGYTNIQSLHNSMEAKFSKMKQNRQNTRAKSNQKMKDLRTQIQENVKFAVEQMDLTDYVSKDVYKRFELKKSDKPTDEQLRSSKEQVKKDLFIELFDRELSGDVDYQQNLKLYNATIHDDVMAYVHFYRARFNSREAAEEINNNTWMPINQILLCRFESVKDVDFFNEHSREYETRMFDGTVRKMKLKFVLLGA